MVTLPRHRDIRCSAQRPATAWTLVGGLLGYPIVVGASRRHREQGLGLLEEADGNPGHGRLMRFHAVPYLDDRQTSRIIALDQELARTTTRGVNDAGNDRAEKVAQRRGVVRRGLELVYPGDRHERVLLRTLALRAHSARFRSLRQHPFGEVKALLRLAQLLPQLAHLGFERVERFEPSRELAPAVTRPQALGPSPERQRARRGNRGRPRLGLPGREPGSRRVH